MQKWNKLQKCLEKLSIKTSLSFKIPHQLLMILFNALSEGIGTQQSH